MASTSTSGQANGRAGGPSGSELPSLPSLLTSSQGRTRMLFEGNASPLGYGHASTSAAAALGGVDAYETTTKARLAAKMGSEYKDARLLPQVLLAQQAAMGPARPGQQPAATSTTASLAGQKRKTPASTLTESYIDELEGGGKPARGIVDASESNGHLSGTSGGTSGGGGGGAGALALRPQQSSRNVPTATPNGNGSLLSTALIRKKEAASRIAKPDYHAQWKLSRVISGHLGWVRAIAVEPQNKWFATGAGDRMIKIWDLASGELKISLTGHISTVRGLAVSSRHPYLFSCGEDKLIKCWDLESNRVIRQYTGHTSGIYCLSLHPTLDVLVTGGRDGVARVWDMRTKSQIHVLGGHKGTVASVVTQESDPQVVTGSMDATVRLWDLAAGRSVTTLTQHKKSVRALATHPQQFSFASGSAGGRNIKTWRCPEGTLLNNMTHDTIVNSMSVNPDGVLFSGGDDGSMRFFDYNTGVPFQSAQDVPQPGSLDAEAGIFCSTFDQTGTRLLTGGADKTIKMYKETA